MQNQLKVNMFLVFLHLLVLFGIVVPIIALQVFFDRSVKNLLHVVYNLVDDFEVQSRVYKNFEKWLDGPQEFTGVWPDHIHLDLSPEFYLDVAIPVV